MPRKRGGVEVVVTLGLLAAISGCSTYPPAPIWPARADNAPDGVDYLMAVQCAGLASALKAFNPNGAWMHDEPHRATFVHWAYNLDAGRVGWETVLRDVEASRKDFIAEAGEGPNHARIGRLMESYGSSYKVCITLADLPDRVFIGG